MLTWDGRKANGDQNNAAEYSPEGSGCCTCPYPLSVGFSKALVSTLQPQAFSICRSQGIHPNGDNESASGLSGGGEKRMEVQAALSVLIGGAGKSPLAHLPISISFNFKSSEQWWWIKFSHALNEQQLPI